MPGTDAVTQSCQEPAERPDVSVVLPIYNAEPYLREALDSLLVQTHTNLEIICVNDGSKDSSLAIITEYAARDPRIIIDDGPNGGYGKAMNRGISRAQGEFIAILEPDDILEPNMFEVLLPLARKNDLDFIRADFKRFVDKPDGTRHFWTIRICSRSRNSYYGRVLNPQDNLDLFNVGMQTWTGITRRSFIEKYNIRLHESPGARFQDNSFWFQTYCWASRIMYVDQAFYCHRDDNPASSTNRSDLTFAMLNEWKWLREYLEQFPEKAQKLMKTYQYRKFFNCNFAFDKLAENLQWPYIERYSNEEKEADAAGEIDWSMFNSQQQRQLHLLIDNPSEYLRQYRDNRHREIEYTTARNHGRAALFAYYVRHRGLLSAIKHSIVHTARAILRRIR